MYRKTIFILTSLILISIQLLGQNYNPQRTELKFNNVIDYISNYYVDTVNMPKLVEKAIVEMLKELDPHSVYFTKEEMEKANEPLVGNFEGVGIQFQVYKDTILVVDAIKGGPSEKLGIRAGDKILKIDNEDATGAKVTSSYVVGKLRGAKGTKVVVSIKRKSSIELIDYTIIRDKIPLNSIDAAFKISKDVGYIRLDRFSRTTMSEFRDAITKLNTEGISSLIFDLRGNSGGYLDVAIDLADEFLPSGMLIVYTEGVNSPMQRYSSTSRGNFEKGKLIVLIDEGSASASEIVSGAIQDWDRGLILGRRSFGKGLVQRPFNLIDGSVIRLTTARYHTPTGRCIQKSYSEGIDKYYEDFSKRMKKGEFIHPDSIKFPDSLKYFTPAKRIVYGGGGIMPDIFVPMDTTTVSSFYVDLRRKRIINDFIVEYVDTKRDSLKSKFISFDEFNKIFKIDNSFMNNFYEFAKKQSVEKKDAEKNTDKDIDSEKFLICQLKALIASNIWGSDKYYRVIIDVDNELKKALEIIVDEKLFKKLKISF